MALLWVSGTLSPRMEDPRRGRALITRILSENILQRGSRNENQSTGFKLTLVPVCNDTSMDWTETVVHVGIIIIIA